MHISHDLYNVLLMYIFSSEDQFKTVKCIGKLLEDEY